MSSTNEFQFSLQETAGTGSLASAGPFPSLQYIIKHAAVAACFWIFLSSPDLQEMKKASIEAELNDQSIIEEYCVSFPSESP